MPLLKVWSKDLRVNDILFDGPDFIPVRITRFTLARKRQYRFIEVVPVLYDSTYGPIEVHKHARVTIVRERYIGSLDAIKNALTVLDQIVPPLPPADARCHVGICAQNDCAYCQRVMFAQIALGYLRGRLL